MQTPGVTNAKAEQRLGAEITGTRATFLIPCERCFVVDGSLVTAGIGWTDGVDAGRPGHIEYVVQKEETPTLLPDIMNAQGYLNRGGTLLTFGQQRRLQQLRRMSPLPFKASDMDLIDLHLVQWCDEECRMVEPTYAENDKHSHIVDERGKLRPHWTTEFHRGPYYQYQSARLFTTYLESRNGLG